MKNNFKIINIIHYSKNVKKRILNIKSLSLNKLSLQYKTIKLRIKSKYLPKLKNKANEIKNDIKPIIEAKLKENYRWLKNSFTPKVHKFGENLVAVITSERGSSNWTVLTPSKRWSRLILITLSSVSGFAIVWAAFARIDESVTSTGKIEPTGTTIDVKAPIGGVIKTILVKEGDIVGLDQILLELDTTAAKSRLEALKKVQSRTQGDVELSRAQLGSDVDESQLTVNQKERLNALKKEYESRLLAAKSTVDQAKMNLRSAEATLDSSKEVLKIRERILEDIKPLEVEGAMSRIQYLKELQEVQSLRGKLISLNADVKKYRAALEEQQSRLTNTKALTVIDFSTKVEEGEKQLAQLKNQISEASLTLRYQEIRSPAKGIVFDLQPSAAGYVVNNNIPVLKIVPTDDLVARIYIPNRDIGFIKIGQEVKIRVDAYPYNEFGELNGTISALGSDVLEPDEVYNYYRFPATVELTTPDLAYKGGKLPLISGMSVNANIILRQRPVISIFTERILPF